jgi:hypothetical protein
MWFCPKDSAIVVDGCFCKRWNVANRHLCGLDVLTNYAERKHVELLAMLVYLLSNLVAY